MYTVPKNTIYIYSQDSPVDWMNRTWFLAGAGKEFSSSPQHPSFLWGPSSLLVHHMYHFTELPEQYGSIHRYSTALATQLCIHTLPRAHLASLTLHPSTYFNPFSNLCNSYNLLSYFIILHRKFYHDTFHCKKWIHLTMKFSYDTFYIFLYLQTV
jgi:hypothetical protein